MLTKRFKNGNITVKMEAHDHDIKESTICKLLWALYDLDCTMFGEEYCISNFDMALDVYSYYSDKLLRIVYSELTQLESGKTIRLIARDLDPDERRTLEELEETGEI